MRATASLLLLLAAAAGAQPLPSDTTDSSAERTAFVAAAGVGVSGYEWVRRRHIDPRPTAPFEVRYDWTYSRWADKLGHAYSTGVQTEAWAAAYRWAGHGDNAAAGLGAVTAFGYMTVYEALDGFDRGTGFDPADIAANAVGAGLVVARAHVPALDAVRLKLSYWPSGGTCDASCDYAGQTMWLTVNPHALAPESIKDVLPAWLNLAVGYGAREGDVNAGFAESVVYVGFDFEPAGLPLSGPVWETVMPWLRHVHVPAPALRLAPDAGIALFAY